MGRYDDYNFQSIGKDLANAYEQGRQETIKEIIDKIDDMIGGKLIAQALREIYLEKE